MTSAVDLLEVLKRELRARKVTYADVAQALELSEASVKRLFSQQDFTLERIDRICALAKIDFGELARAAERDKQTIARFTREQEEEIVGDPKLMLVALLVMNTWTYEQILEDYALTEAELVGLLTRLDKLRLIELLPGNRIRPLIAKTFSWIPDGPMQRYFKAQAARDFLDARFDGANELMLVVNGKLGPSSAGTIVERLKRVATEFAEAHNEDTRLPFAERKGITLLVAVRPWDYTAFEKLRRPSAATLVRGTQRRARRSEEID